MPVKEQEKAINVAIDKDLYWELKKEALDKRVTLRSLIMSVLREHLSVAEPVNNGN